MLTGVDPMTGDKRAREEDTMDTRPATRGMPASNDGGQHAMPNGAMGMAAVDMGMQEAMDALYIGDLQWVRAFSFLLVRIVTLTVGIGSGRQMRTSVRLLFRLA